MCVLFFVVRHYASQSTLADIIPQDSLCSYAVRDILSDSIARMAREPLPDGYGCCGGSVCRAEYSRRDIYVLGDAHLYSVGGNARFGSPIYGA